MLFAGLAIFFGSFLLFGIQPMLGRTLLPSFGGTAAVWTACLVAYQILLLVGYIYAHYLNKLKPKTQRFFHLFLLVLASAWTLLFAMFQRHISAWLGNSGVPSVEVVVAVSLIVGLPYVMLASGSTLLQAWAATLRKGRGRGTYRLYALSNLGSFLGLFVHPLILDPFVTVSWQWRGFAVGMCAYALLVAGISKRVTAGPSQHVETATPPHTFTLTGRLSSPVLWFALPCLSSFLLVATTNQFTLDITPLTLMWAVVLGLFLLSYVLGFSSTGEKLMPLWMLLSAVSLVVLATLTMGGGKYSPMDVLKLTLRFGLPAFLFVLLFLHAWLYAIRPDTEALTKYYLGNASGGAFGGILAGVVAPVVFRTVAEYPIALVVSAGMTAWFVFEYWHPKMKNGLNQLILAVCVFVPIKIFLGAQADRDIQMLYQGRDFYGVVSVKQYKNVNELLHGSTRHGVQITASAELRKLPTAYFGETGGGLIFRHHRKYAGGEPVRFGGIGLGIGVLAAYGREGDVFRFYEISPEVIKVAENREWFTFLSDCAATLEIVEGDARKALELEAMEDAPKYDIFVVDAFSGDSIPMHLITSEAFDLYRRRLADNGILAVHISNWQFDLFPLLKAQMQRMGMQGVGTIGNGEKAKVTEISYWAFFTEAPLAIGPSSQQVEIVNWDAVEDKPLISDACGSLLHFLDN